MKLSDNANSLQGNMFLTVDDAAQLLHISTSHAYKVIHRLNMELKAQGYLTIAGRISRDYLLERAKGKTIRKEESNHVRQQG